MWDTRPVEVVLRLPEDLAHDVREVQESDPEFLSKVIRYGLTRRAMFRELSHSLAPPDPTSDAGGGLRPG